MTKFCAGNSADGPLLFKGGKGAARCRAALHLTEGLRLAAAPTFAVMALLAGLPGDGGTADFLCLTADHASPLSGMVPMYLLMSAFHLPPWLKLLFGQGNGAGRPSARSTPSGEAGVAAVEHLGEQRHDNGRMESPLATH